MQGGQIDIFSENNITEKAVFKQNPEELREQAIWRGAEQHSGWEDWVQSPEAERARGLRRCGWRTVSKRRDGREVVRRPDHTGRGNMDMGRQAPLEDFCKAQECYELLTYVLFILNSPVNQVFEKMLHCHHVSWWDAPRKTHHFCGSPDKNVWPESYGGTAHKPKLRSTPQNNWLVPQKCQCHERRRKNGDSCILQTP